MSEADSPNDQPVPTATESSEPVTAVHSADSERLHPAPDDGWQTVDFPGAISVDALPHKQTEALGDAIEPGVIHYSNAEIDLATTYVAAIPFQPSGTVTQLQQLQDENAALRDHLAQVEQDLVQQIEQQLEAACTLSQPEAAIDEAVASTIPMLEQSKPLQSAHDRLQQLMQALERSHQTAQRQQILVETLTAQLESSQERIAQLERDCALTKQHYNEQVQQVLQAESACRDLRLRLHRQQQQTLQFKAALEKCLEMPTVYENQVIPDDALTDGSTPPDALSALLKPKNQPVKPWSLPSQASQAAADQLERPKPLVKLLNQGMPAQGDETDLLQENAALVTGLDAPFNADGQGNATADPSTLLDSDDPQFVTHLMQLIFPDTAERLSYTTTDAVRADGLQSEAIFDLSPFLAVESASIGTVPPVGPSSREADLLTTLPESVGTGQQEPFDGLPSDASAIANLSISTPSDDRPTDPLWRDLETLIAPLPTVASINLGADGDADTPNAPVNAVQATTDSAGIPPLFTAPHEVTTAVEAAPLKVATDPTAPLTAWTWRDRLVNTNKTPQAPMIERAAVESTPQTPSKLLALSAGSLQSSMRQQTINVSSQPECPSASFSTAVPSPIVYPLRPTKKLASLAAVDLPTFPRR